MFTMIVAVGDNNEMGKGNTLPWNLQKDDLLRFYNITNSHDGVIMGMKTYNSIPEDIRPLPNRVSLVLTRSTKFEDDQTEQHPDLNAMTIYKPNIDLLIERSKGKEKVNIIVAGGLNVYEQFLDEVDIIYMTKIKNEFPEADVHFPKLDMKNWVIVQTQNFEADDRNEYAYQFMTLIRKSVHESTIHPNRKTRRNIDKKH